MTQPLGVFQGTVIPEHLVWVLGVKKGFSPVLDLFKLSFHTILEVNSELAMVSDYAGRTRSYAKEALSASGIPAIGIDMAKALGKNSLVRS